MPKRDVVWRIDQVRPYNGQAPIGGWPAREVIGLTGLAGYSYVIYETDGVCYAVNGWSGVVELTLTDYATVIQYALDQAGIGGSLLFRPGSYPINRPLTPGQRQTLWLAASVCFMPLGDHAVWELSHRDYLAFHGTLCIVDDVAVTQSAPALRMEDNAFCYFERIVISNTFRGIDLSGQTGGTHENYFGDIWMQVRDRGINLTYACHDNHFNHVWIKGPAPDQWASGPGLRIATDGTQGGNVFHEIEILDMNWGMDLPGAYETWFGNVLIDNAYGAGIWISGQCERLFFDTVWTASGGNGVIIEGNANALPVTYADKIHFNKLYTWLNANHGLRFDGYTRWVTFGTLVAQRNAKGVAFYNAHNEDIIINALITLENTEWGLNGANVGDHVVIQHATIEDSLLNGDMFARLGGYTATGNFKTAGVAVMPQGTSEVMVNHGLDQTPTVVMLGPRHAEVADAYVAASTATTFTIAVTVPVTADRQIAWLALSRANAL